MSKHKLRTDFSKTQRIPTLEELYGTSDLNTILNATAPGAEDGQKDHSQPDATLQMMDELFGASSVPTSSTKKPDVPVAADEAAQMKKYQQWKETINGQYLQTLESLGEQMESIEADLQKQRPVAQVGKEMLEAIEQLQTLYRKVPQAATMLNWANNARDDAEQDKLLQKADDIFEKAEKKNPMLAAASDPVRHKLAVLGDEYQVIAGKEKALDALASTEASVLQEMKHTTAHLGLIETGVPVFPPRGKEGQRYLHPDILKGIYPRYPGKAIDMQEPESSQYQNSLYFSDIEMPSDAVEAIPDTRQPPKVKFSDKVNPRNPLADEAKPEEGLTSVVYFERRLNGKPSPYLGGDKNDYKEGCKPTDVLYTKVEGPKENWVKRVTDATTKEHKAGQEQKGILKKGTGSALSF